MYQNQPVNLKTTKFSFFRNYINSIIFVKNNFNQLLKVFMTIIGYFVLVGLLLGAGLFLDIIIHNFISPKYDLKLLGGAFSIMIFLISLFLVLVMAPTILSFNKLVLSKIRHDSLENFSVKSYFLMPVKRKIKIVLAMVKLWFYLVFLAIIALFMAFLCGWLISFVTSLLSSFMSVDSLKSLVSVIMFVVLIPGVLLIVSSLGAIYLIGYYLIDNENKEYLASGQAIRFVSKAKNWFKVILLQVNLWFIMHVQWICWFVFEPWFVDAYKSYVTYGSVPFNSIMLCVLSLVGCLVVSAGIGTVAIVYAGFFYNHFCRNN